MRQVPRAFFLRHPPTCRGSESTAPCASDAPQRAPGRAAVHTHVRAARTGARALIQRHPSHEQKQSASGSGWGQRLVRSAATTASYIIGSARALGTKAELCCRHTAQSQTRSAQLHIVCHIPTEPRRAVEGWGCASEGHAYLYLEPPRPLLQDDRLHDAIGASGAGPRLSGQHRLLRARRSTARRRSGTAWGTARGK